MKGPRRALLLGLIVLTSAIVIFVITVSLDEKHELSGAELRGLRDRLLRGDQMLDEEEVAALETYLFRDGRHPTEEELEALENARYRAEGGEFGPVSPQPYNPPPATPDPEPTPGIFRQVDAVSGYSWKNAWVGPRVGARDTVVLAGSLSHEPKQGVVVVESRSAYRGHLSFDEYPTPVMAGAVRVVSFRGWTLTLRSEDGHTFVFDVRGRTFE